MEIEADLCGVCEKCIPVCPNELIIKVGYTMKVKEGCVNCGECYNICPLGAIFLDE
ncbi:MAG: 4Fe-4S binding protein [archaeon]|nr:4Fe-4S binding protein [archaeon]